MSQRNERPATERERASVDNTRSATARAHTLDMKRARIAKRFISGGAK